MSFALAHFWRVALFALAIQAASGDDECFLEEVNALAYSSSFIVSRLFIIFGLILAVIGGDGETLTVRLKCMIVLPGSLDCVDRANRDSDGNSFKRSALYRNMASRCAFRAM